MKRARLVNPLVTVVVAAGWLYLYLTPWVNHPKSPLYVALEQSGFIAQTTFGLVIGALLGISFANWITSVRAHPGVQEANRRLAWIKFGMVALEVTVLVLAREGYGTRVLRNVGTTDALRTVLPFTWSFFFAYWLAVTSSFWIRPTRGTEHRQRCCL